MATSSFEYFPGVPLFESADLVHFRAIGHALTRRSQLELEGAKSSKGIFAPTLRYHAGTFYLVTTNMSGGGNFYVTASDPAGPWSEPVWLHEDDWGMDPSLFFDDDGRVYYTRHGGGEHGGIYQAELDVERGKLLDEPRLVWSGTGGRWPEGPHLYKLAGRYYLMISEGGTSYEHSLTLARSSSPWGPFEPCPRNPLLTHRDRPAEPIQATGHADLVETESGALFLVLLGIRPTDGAHHHLGRETFLCPLSMADDGWPLVNGGAPIGLEMEAEGLPRPVPVAETAPRDDFDADELAIGWITLRNVDAARFSLGERPGWLRLHGTRTTLDDVASPAFVARRQCHFRCRAATRLDFLPEHAGDQAGLVVRANEDNHYDLVVVPASDGPRARLCTRVQGVSSVVGEVPVGPGPWTLSIEAYPDRYEFFVAPRTGTALCLGSAPTVPLSSEAAGGFTGACVGLFAASEKDPAPPADFDWFELSPLAPRERLPSTTA